MSSWMLRRIEMGGGQKPVAFPFLSSAHALGKHRTRKRWSRSKQWKQDLAQGGEESAGFHFQTRMREWLGSSRRLRGGTFSRATHWSNLGTASPDSKLFVSDLGPSLRSLHPSPIATSPHWPQNLLILRIPEEWVQVWILPGVFDQGSKTWNQDKGQDPQLFQELPAVNPATPGEKNHYKHDHPRVLKLIHKVNFTHPQLRSISWISTPIHLHYHCSTPWKRTEAEQK